MANGLGFEINARLVNNSCEFGDGPDAKWSPITTVLFCSAVSAAFWAGIIWTVLTLA